MQHDCTVIQLRHHRKGDAMVYCRGCDQDLPEEAFSVDKMRSTGRRYKCKKCSSAEYQNWSQTQGYVDRLNKQKKQRAELKQTNPKQRWANMTYNGIKRRAKASNLSMTITKKWLLDNAVDFCPALGLKLKYDNTASHKDSPAVDRLDNTKGYDPDNCWVISMQANRIKNDATADEIDAVARAVRKRERATVDERMDFGVRAA